MSLYPGTRTAQQRTRCAVLLALLNEPNMQKELRLPFTDRDWEWTADVSNKKQPSDDVISYSEFLWWDRLANAVFAWDVKSLSVYLDQEIKESEAKQESPKQKGLSLVRPILHLALGSAKVDAYTIAIRPIETRLFFYRKVIDKINTSWRKEQSGRLFNSLEKILRHKCDSTNQYIFELYLEILENTNFRFLPPRLYSSTKLLCADLPEAKGMNAF